MGLSVLRFDHVRCEIDGRFELCVSGIGMGWACGVCGIGESVVCDDLESSGQVGKWNDMTKSEYVNNGLTRWDRFRLKFFWAPAALLVGFILWGLAFGGGEITYDQGRVFLLIWIPVATVAVVFHQGATKKVNRLIENWENLK